MESIACLNNITDPDTNIYHIGVMIEMVQLKENQLASGLIWHSLDKGYAVLILYIISFFQFIISLALWRAVFSYINFIFSKKSNLNKIITDANYALIFFVSMWLIFLCGGLWFGYWIKQGAIQNVHISLLLISLGCFVSINLPDPLINEQTLNRRI